jgi:hypothetical protein
MLRLGFFEKFGGRDSVLLHGTPSDLRHLLGRLRAFVASVEAHLPIHEVATVAPNHPVELYAIKSVKAPNPPNPSGSTKTFFWDCMVDWVATQDMLENLVAPSRPKFENALPGYHQYFDLNMPENQLVVAVDEYDDSWWARFG